MHLAARQRKIVIYFLKTYPLINLTNNVYFKVPFKQIVHLCVLIFV